MTSTSKKVFFTAAALVLAFVALEIVLRIVVAFSGLGPPDPREKAMLGRANLKIVRETDWGQEFFLREVEGLHATEFDLLTGWHAPEFHGKYLNIDAEGKRKTWNPEVPAGASTTKIFMFGGSTAWGAGARDEFTIASMLSKKLNAEAAVGRAYIVHNYGQPGHSSLVEAAKLLQLLQEGERPDIVVFYDGGNDVLGAYQMGVAGPKGIEQAVETLFRSTVGQSAGDRAMQWAKDTIKKLCVTCRMAFNAESLR